MFMIITLIINLCRQFHHLCQVKRQYLEQLWSSVRRRSAKRVEVLINVADLGCEPEVSNFDDRVNDHLFFTLSDRHLLVYFEQFFSKCIIGSTKSLYLNEQFSSVELFLL